jgi:uncharacterized glyoxalase superfamily protein PhnB
MSAKTIAIVLRYRDPRRAAAWLCEAFGFTLDRIAEAEPGTLDYICLSYGPSTVLICPEDHTSAERGPASERQTCYLTVENIAAHYETAKAEGALLERKLERAEDGSELYVCRDPEGCLWSIGTHAFSTPPAAPAPPAARTRGIGLGLAAFATLAASALTAGAVLILSGPAAAPPQSYDVAVTESDGELTTGSLGDVPLSTIAAREREIGELRDDLASLQREHVGQAATIQRAKAELAAAIAERTVLQSDLAAAQSELARLRTEADAARDAAAEADARLASLAESQQGEANASDLAEARAARAAEALEQERQARKKAEADLAVASTARAEAEAAREAALADREAAAARLAAIEDAKKETAESLTRTREALVQANADFKSAENRHLEAIAAKDKIIASLNAQLSAKATIGASTPAKPKPKGAATRAPPPAARKAQKPAAQSKPAPLAEEDTIDPAALRRCGQDYYERC